MSTLKLAKDVLELEAKAIMDASNRLTEANINSLIQIFDNLIKHNGQLVIAGVGKSGLIGQKMASTFSSLGLPSFFLHPTEALHGDLGRLRSNDALVIISKSGNTEELKKFLPFIDCRPNMIIGLLGRVDSDLAKECGLVLDCSVVKEACLNNLAPTTSTTVAMAMGDAMAVIYEHLVGLSPEGFAVNHPGGLLGKSLKMKVKDLMHSKSNCAVVGLNSMLRDVILAMTNMPMGACAVIDDADQFLGVIVEGDIRRTFASGDGNGLDKAVAEIMNDNPVSVSPDLLAFDALKLMEQREREISVVPVIENGQFIGLLRLHDLLKEGLKSS